MRVRERASVWELTDKAYVLREGAWVEWRLVAAGGTIKQEDQGQVGTTTIYFLIHTHTSNMNASRGAPLALKNRPCVCVCERERVSIVYYSIVHGTLHGRPARLQG